MGISQGLGYRVSPSIVITIMGKDLFRPFPSVVVVSQRCGPPELLASSRAGIFRVVTEGFGWGSRV